MSAPTLHIQEASMHDCVDAYLSHKAAMVDGLMLKPATLNNYRKIAKVIVADMGTEPVSTIRRLRIDRYIAHRKTAGISSGTINGELEVLRAILRHAAEEGHIDAPPTIRKVPHRVRDEDAPDPAVVAAWLDTLPPEYADPLRFSMFTGLSWHEIERLHREDVSLGREPVVRIGERIGFTTKTACRQRTIPLSAPATRIARAAKAREDDDPRMFPHAPNTRYWLYNHRTAEDAKLYGHLTPKDMRSLFASIAARTVPEAVLQRLMGHSPGSRVTRRHYVRVPRADLEAGMRAVAGAF